MNLCVVWQPQSDDMTQSHFYARQESVPDMTLKSPPHPFPLQFLWFRQTKKNMFIIFTFAIKFVHVQTWYFLHFFDSY